MKTSCTLVYACLAVVFALTGTSDAFVVPAGTVGPAPSMTGTTAKSTLVYGRRDSRGGRGLSMSMDEGSTRGVCVSVCVCAEMHVRAIPCVYFMG